MSEDTQIETLILKRLKATSPTEPLSLVEYVQRSMPTAGHFETMAAVWRLADDDKVEFTPKRLLRLAKTA